MDRFLYVAMTGAREVQLAQAVTANNLANVSTTGFRATLAGTAHVGLEGPGHAEARAYAAIGSQGTDFSSGPIVATGRALDVAVEGSGWIAVQAPDGGEAYTRAGDLQIDAFGRLTTGSGLPVLGDGGPIAVPPHESLQIGSDGTVSIRPLGQQASALAQVGRIRLVDPPEQELARGEDGLFRLAGGQPAEADAGVTLRSGALEGSNVSSIQAMVEMIEHARAFEMHVRLMDTAEQNDQASSRLLGQS